MSDATTRLTPTYGLARGVRAGTIALVLLAVMALGSATAGAASLPASYLPIVDQGGANDVNSSQNDLTQFGRDSSDATSFKLLWSWDATDDWTGNGQTGNACALFDSNNNGNVDFVICVAITNPNGNSSTVVQASGSPYAFSCGDAKNDRCDNPTPVSIASGAVVSGAIDPVNGTPLNTSPTANLITPTDPFLNLNPDQNWNNDSTIGVTILKSFLTSVLGSVPSLINVCSYPSAGNGGNNNPFDCIIRPGDGLMKIVKVVPAGTSGTFNFSVNGDPKQVTAPTPGELGPFGAPFTPASGPGSQGTTISETVPATWSFTSAVCKLEDGTTTTGTLNGTTISGVKIESGKVTTCTYTNAPKAPALTIVKTNDADHDGTFNDVETVPSNATYPYVVTYKVVISNAATSFASTITSITDDKVAPPLRSATVGLTDCADVIGTSIASGGTVTCYFDATFNNANLGQVVNTASATATNPGGSDTKTDTSTVNLGAVKSIQLTKSATLQLGQNGTLEAGDTILYGFVVLNNGNVTLTGVDLDDALVNFTDATCGLTTLTAGQSTSCQATYTLTQADIDAGTRANSATACGAPPTGPDVCDTDATSTPLTPTKAIQLTKSATLQTGQNQTLEAGDTILYSFVIQNIGNVTLTGVDLDDALVSFTDATCGATTLAPGASTSCQATYTLTQADIDAGSVANTATACGAPPSGTDICDTDGTSTPLGANKAIQLTKSATLQTGQNQTLEAGDTILYSFVIQNIGNVTLTGVDLDDALVNLTDATCGQTTLAPGASTSCNVTYTLTQADIDAGTRANSATACGAPPTGPDVCDTDATSTPLTPTKAIQLTKSATLQTGQNQTLEAGDTILYSFVIQNIGNVTLTGVDLDDALLAYTDVTCGQTTLVPGGSTSCTATYTLTQGDIDAGSVANTGNACGAPPSGTDVCDTDSTSTPLAPNTAIQLTKSATLDLGQDKKLQAGDTVNYTFVIQNIGNVTLAGVDLDDSLLGYTDVACGQTTLAPGASTTCSATYTLTQADIDAGSVANTGNACGTPPAGADVCDTDSTSTPLGADTAIQLTKTATLDLGQDKKLQAGDKVNYTFTIQNIGNVTLTGVDLDDALLGFTDVACGATTLAPGASTTCNGVHTITQADIDAGTVTNTATACGTPPVGADVCDTDTAMVDLVPDKGVKLVKSGALQLGADNKLQPGDTVQYTFTITNTGNATLSSVDLTDALVGYNDATCGQTSLAPGASTTCQASYTVTQADIDAGKVTNSATACGLPPRSQVEVCDDDTIDTPLAGLRAIAVVKSGPAFAYHGDSVTFTYKVTNTGTVTLPKVEVSDDKCAPVNGPTDKQGGNADSVLDPGEIWTYTCTTAIGAHALGEENPVVNTVTAVGTDPKGTDVSASDKHSTQILHPAVAVDKSGPAEANAGERVKYTLLVTNPGDAPVLGQTLAVTDNLCDAPPLLVAKARGSASDPTPDTLDPGDTWVYECFVQTQAGQTSVVNTGLVNGTDVNGKPVTASDDAATTLNQIQVLPEVVVSGASKLSGPAGCVTKPFKVKVTGRQIAKVTFKVDGKTVKTFRNAAGTGKRFTLKINPKRFGAGVHRLKATVTYSAASKTAQRTLQLAFEQCRKQVIRPVFTG